MIVFKTFAPALCAGTLVLACFANCGPGAFETHESGLQWRDNTIGEGETPQPGDILKVHYTGKTSVGGQDVEFFNSYDRKRPVTLPYLEDRLIRGFVIGLKDMRPGGKRSLIVPPELGYGDEGAGQVIPPDSTLQFEMELVDIKKGPTPWDVSEQQVLRHPAGYQYVVLDAGDGPRPGPGEYIMLKYHKYQADGTLLDTSDYYATPYEFHLGQPEVPASWNAILPLMRPKARYRIVVPPTKLAAENPGQQVPVVMGIFYDIELLGVDENHLHQ